jgi:NAD(P)-dependent dehydrogenase (short-subunit alcohol dehydrogenase family)
MGGRVVVVTGASAGVGRAVARLFAAQGDSVGLIARGRDGLEAARREIETAGGRAVAVQADVADAAQVEAAAEAIESQLGPIEVWVNDAMVSVFAPVSDLLPDEVKRVTEVTYLGAVYGTMAALKRMRPRNRGVIIQVGSALAYRGIPLQAAYCAAKHAMHGFTESLRTELLHDKSRVKLTMVQLPAMNTPQFEWSRAKMPRQPQPVPPIYQPEVAARAIVWVSRHHRRELNVGGSTAMTVVANHFVPGLIDRYLARVGYKKQQTGASLPPDRQDNLWEPVPGDHGAHGIFDSRSSDWSAQLWITEHRWLALPALALLGLLVRTGWPRGIRL